MSLRRHLNKEGVAHANADSNLHGIHVRQRKQRQKIAWAPEVVHESTAEEFRLNTENLPIGKGAYFSGFKETEKSVSGEAFEAHCNAINQERKSYFAPMKRGSKVSTVRRKLSSDACEEFVVNFSPAQMRFINGELALWEQGKLLPQRRKELLLSFTNDIRSSLVEEFQIRSGRDVVASYLHFDSNKIHVGIVHSRIGPENRLVGKKRLGTVGPWSVGQNRLGKLGLIDEGDNRLKENMEKFHTRHGSKTIPLDILLHDHLDKRFDCLVGVMGANADQRFNAAIEHYRQWKVQARRQSVLQSPSSQKMTWQILRIVTPLLPPQVRVALSICRTATQALGVVTKTIDAISPTTKPQNTPIREIDKIL